MALPLLRADMDDEEIDQIAEKATEAAAFLKAISH